MLLKIPQLVVHSTSLFACTCSISLDINVLNSIIKTLIRFPFGIPSALCPFSRLPVGHQSSPQDGRGPAYISNQLPRRLQASQTNHERLHLDFFLQCISRMRIYEWVCCANVPRSNRSSRPAFMNMCDFSGQCAFRGISLIRLKPPDHMSSPPTESTKNERAIKCRAIGEGQDIQTIGG